MDGIYAMDPQHFDTGLMRKGLTEYQARAYAAYFRTLRKCYYEKVRLAYQVLIRQGEGTEVRVLDVGCGLGEDCHALAQILPDAHFVGVDISPAAIELCQSRACANMEYLCGALQELPLRE